MIIKVYDKELEEYHTQLIDARNRMEELQLRINHLYNEMSEDIALLGLPAGEKAAERVLYASQTSLKLYQDLCRIETAVTAAIEIYETTEKELSKKMNGASQQVDAACAVLSGAAGATDEERVNNLGVQFENKTLGELMDSSPAGINSTDITATMNDVNAVYAVYVTEPGEEDDQEGK